MAVIQEQVNINGKIFIHTYSDTGHYVVGGEPYGEYNEVYDPEELNRQYTEGDLIPTNESDIEELLNIILGEID